jgi:acyl carrier protein
MDNHFHHTIGDRNERPSPVPIVIGPDCVIGPRAILMPGAELGAGARVGPAAVVSFRVPAGRCVPLESAGTPAPEVDAAARVPTAGAKHSRDEVRSAIIEWLDDTRHFGQAASLVRSDSMSLREGGLLDSLGLVQLVLMLEKRFGVAIDRKWVSRPDSQSIDAFAALVTRHPAGRP